MTDKEKIELGIARLASVRRDYGTYAYFVVVEQLGINAIRHGYEARADVIAHVVGNVSEEEWLAMVERGATTHGWKKTS